MKVVCLVGESGAGKGTAINILREYGYVPHILGNEVRLHAQESGLVNPSRADLQYFANATRRKEGADYYVSRILRRIQAQKVSQIAIDGARNLSEINRIRELASNGAQVNVVGIVADPEVRFTRIMERRDSSDPLTYAEFLENDHREKGIGGDEFSQQNALCLADADIVIENNTTLTELRGRLVSSLQLEIHRKVEGVHYYPGKERY